MVKRSIEQEIRNKNFGARNGNFEKNAVVKNQGTKQRGQRILGDCWQWETNGQCVKGDNCSFRHDMNKRGRSSPSNPSPNSFMRQNERKPSRTRSPRGKSPSGRMSRWPCKDYLRGTCNNSFCVPSSLLHPLPPSPPPFLPSSPSALRSWDFKCALELLLSAGQTTSSLNCSSSFLVATVANQTLVGLVQAPRLGRQLLPCLVAQNGSTAAGHLRPAIVNLAVSGCLRLIIRRESAQPAQMGGWTHAHVGLWSIRHPKNPPKASPNILIVTCDETFPVLRPHFMQPEVGPGRPAQESSLQVVRPWDPLKEGSWTSSPENPRRTLVDQGMPRTFNPCWASGSPGSPRHTTRSGLTALAALVNCGVPLDSTPPRFHTCVFP